MVSPGQMPHGMACGSERPALASALRAWLPVRVQLERALLVAGIVGAWSAGGVRAATPLMIWPVDPVIPAGQSAAALWVENRGLQPVSLQVRVMGWSQSDGVESFTAQRAVMASPPISMIPPGKRQMVRLVAVQAAPSERELAYRVLIDELPAPDGASAPEPAGNQTGMGIRLSVRYAIPLFQYGSGAHPHKPRQPMALAERGKPLLPALSWQTARQGQRHRLVVRNEGRGHARITAVRWASAQPAPANAPGDGVAASSAQEVTINEGLMGYVLPDSQMHWELEQPPPANPVLRATINGEETLVPRGAE